MDKQANPAHTGTIRDGFRVQRRFLQTLTAVTGSLLTMATLPRAFSTHAAKSSHLQDSCTADSHYCDCHKFLKRLCSSDCLSLSQRRQPNTPRDTRAIEVFWRKQKPGQPPQLEDTTTASLADRGCTLHACTLATDAPENAWEPVRLRVWTTTTLRRNQHGI